MNEPAMEPERPAEDRTRIRYLSPDTCRIHLGTHQALHVTVTGERIYGGVYAAYAFPVRCPDGYVSLIYTGGEGGEREIGVIRALSDFPPEQADLVRDALRRRYFIHTITAIRAIRWKHGYVAIDADTDKGPVSFMMRWQHASAVDYGRNGKVLIDLDDNRYVIPDVTALPTRQLRDFRRFIYW